MTCPLPLLCSPASCPPACIQLWVLDLACAPAHDGTPLSPEETERLASMRDPQRRAVFTMVRKALRRGLAGMLACDPAEVTFVTGWNGKPALAPDPLRALPFFSVTHSGRYAMIAVSHCGEIGIDLEAEALRRRDLRVAARFFAASEVAFLDSLPAKRQLSAFTGLWTLKEAVIKATGEGLARRLDSFAIDLNACRMLQQPTTAPAGPWCLRRLPAPPGYQAALALRGDCGPRSSFTGLTTDFRLAGKQCPRLQ